MTGDPIIDEVRRVREGFARRADYKVDRIFATLREGEARPDPDHPLAENADHRDRPAVVREDAPGGG
jgi:hypothetical protein